MNKSSLTVMKTKLKEEVLRLRKQGWSYGKISKKLHIPKATVAFWSHHPKTPLQSQYILTPARLESIKKGWEACRRKRIERTNIIRQQAYNEVEKIQLDNNNLWLTGVMLYWAEGAKCKGKHLGHPIAFSNSDPLMIKLFILWLKKILLITDNEIKIDIYIHENHKYRLTTVRRYWSKIIGYPIKKFDRIYFKKHNIKTKRKNIGNNYFGLIKVNVSKSTDKNRKIECWTKAICAKWGVV